MHLLLVIAHKPKSPSLYPHIAAIASLDKSVSGSTGQIAEGVWLLDAATQMHTVRTLLDHLDNVPIPYTSAWLSEWPVFA